MRSATWKKLGIRVPIVVGVLTCVTLMANGGSLLVDFFNGLSTKNSATTPTVVADNGSVAVGRDVIINLNGQDSEQFMAKLLDAWEARHSKDQPRPSSGAPSQLAKNEDTKPLVGRSHEANTSVPDLVDLKPRFAANNLLQLSQPENLATRIGINFRESSIALAGNSNMAKPSFGAMNPLGVTGSDITRQFASTSSVLQSSHPEGLITQIGTSAGISPTILANYDAARPNLGIVNGFSIFGSDQTKLLSGAGNLLQPSQLEGLTTPIGTHDDATPIVLASYDVTKPIFGAVASLGIAGSDITKQLSSAASTPLQSAQIESLTIQIGIDGGVGSIAHATYDPTKLNLGIVSAFSIFGSDPTKLPSATSSLLQPENATTRVGINGGASPIVLASYDVTKPNVGAVNSLFATGNDIAKQFSSTSSLLQSSQLGGLTTQIGTNGGAGSIGLASYEATKPNFGPVNTSSSIVSD